MAVRQDAGGGVASSGVFRYTPRVTSSTGTKSKGNTKKKPKTKTPRPAVKKTASAQATGRPRKTTKVSGREATVKPADYDEQMAAITGRPKYVVSGTAYTPYHAIQNQLEAWSNSPNARWAAANLPSAYDSQARAWNTAIRYGNQAAPYVGARQNPNLIQGVPPVAPGAGPTTTPYTPTPPKTGGGGSRRYSGSRGGYRPYSRSGYSRSYGGGGGGGGGGGLREWEQYGITPDVWEAYREFWGNPMAEPLWPQFPDIMQLYSNYFGRMPQLDDWQQIWEAIQADYGEQGLDRAQAYRNPALYGPLFAGMVPPQGFVPPEVTYAPGISF